MIFRNLPFRKELFLALRQAGRPSFYKRLYFDGIFRVSVDQDHSFLIHHNNRYGIETELFWRGLSDGWEAASLNVWIKLCRRAEIILDVGAAEGLYALVAGSIRPTARILAFEPAPQKVRELSSNLAINGHDTRCFQVALANYEGRAQFVQASPESNEGHLVSGHKSSTDSFEVDVTTVEKILKLEGLDKVDLLKLDVEGAEPEVLMGMGSLLSRHKPSMIVEILNDDMGHRIEALIGDFGYLYFDINDDSRNGPRDLKRVERLRAARCLNYLIVQPAMADAIGIT